MKSVTVVSKNNLYLRSKRFSYAPVRLMIAQTTSFTSSVSRLFPISADSVDDIYGRLIRV